MIRKSAALKKAATLMVVAAIAAGLSSCSPSENARTSMPEQLEAVSVEQVEPEQTAQEQVEPEQTTHEQVKPEQTAQEQVEPEQTTQEQVEPEQTTHEQVKPEQATQEQVKPEQTAQEQVKPEQTAQEQVKPEQTTQEPIFLGMHTYGISTEEIPMMCSRGTYVHPLFKTEDMYIIQNGYDLAYVPIESVSIVNYEPRWESACTAGCITPGYWGLTLDLDPVNETLRGTCVKVLEPVHILGINFSIDTGTVLLLWGTYDDRYSIACWYDQYLIIPTESVEFEEFDRFNIPKSVTTVGIFFHPLVLPETDIHNKIPPTIIAKVKIEEETVFVHGIERNQVTIYTGDMFEAFNLAESSERIFGKYGDSFIFIPKEAVEIFPAPVG